MMKNRILLVCVLGLGAAFAQETELRSPPPPIEYAAPPVPQSQERTTLSKDEIVDFPDVEAKFPEGTEAMKKFIQDNVKYPEVSLRKGDQGRVYVVFIVERDGSISGIEVMRGGQTAELNTEAMRLVKIMPIWVPGEVAGETVRSRCRLPITFQLSSGEDEKKTPKKN